MLLLLYTALVGRCGLSLAVWLDGRLDSITDIKIRAEEGEEEEEEGGFLLRRN